MTVIIHDVNLIPNPMANIGMMPFNSSLLFEFETKFDPTTTTSLPCPENISGTLPVGPVEDSWYYPYSLAEVIWGVVLIAGIFGVNIWILWVVGRSRELWKPRHLWMACLCITDLFVGAHKVFELTLLVLPGTLRELCIIQKATLGIPYVVNMLLLTLLSLDRFIAVRYPFFYSASVSNKHVVIGFMLVLLTGSALAAASITLGLRDPVCRAQSLQLVYLTIVLTICSILTLFFNSSVLRIAKKQLNAIYAHEPDLGRKRVSLVCTNCGYKNETFVSTLIPIPVSLPIPIPVSSTNCHGDMVLGSGSTLQRRHMSPGPASTLLPATDSGMLGPLDLGIPNGESPLHLELLDSQTIHVHDARCLMQEDSPLIRTFSLPALPDAMSGSLSLMAHPDSSLPHTLGNGQADMDVTGKMNSMSQLDVSPVPQVPQTLPRSRSLVSCRTHKILPPVGPKLHLFRHLHFTRTHMFHVGRLFPSIRFARTVLLIMIPMWVFILPIVTIIPLHRNCEDGAGTSEFDCSIVDMLWKYLLVHMRSVLPLQAILDTLIYAFGSKEFRQSVQKISYRRARRK